MAESDHTEQMSRGESASILWRRKWLVLLPVVLAGATALLLTLSQTPMYRASAEVLVRIPPTADSLASSNSETTQRDIQNELQIASGSTLQDQVRETVGNEPTLSVEESADSDVFEFTATSSTADATAFAANTYAEQYIEAQSTTLIDEYGARAEVLKSEIAAIDAGESDESRLSEYERELEDLEVSTQLATTAGAVLINAATPPSSPFEPDTMLIVALSLGAGLLIGLAAAFLLDHFDPNPSEENLAEASSLQNLATIPKLTTRDEGRTHVITREEPFSASAEAYRYLRGTMYVAKQDRALHLVLVTSPGVGDGKSTTASNLAVTAARSGQRVLLIDCNLRTPRLQDFFNLPNETGFTSVLLGETKLPRVAQTIPGEGNLLVVTSGPLPADPPELLSGEALSNTLGSVGDRVDLVILDAPPVLTTGDSLILATLVDGVIVVASAEATNVEQMTSAVNRLREVNAPILGMVLNKVGPTEHAVAAEQMEPTIEEQPETEPTKSSN